ncbi:Cleavage stimulation factor 50 kDa subunit [Aphelenchoides fujianensis]|nr:Cleavage stimulation factor 50 kDa subunit [Aphelenchoides fujianensis]
MKGELKDRDLMYKLIIGQLFYDGHQQLAVNLSTTIGVSMQPPPPSDKLFRLVSEAKQFVEDPEAQGEPKFQCTYEHSGLDLEYDADVQPTTPEPSMYETIYVTAHKGACRAAAFNLDGSLLATGSEDSSIKILDVEKIIGRSVPSFLLSFPSFDSIAADANELADGPDMHHPVIRTLYDHVAVCSPFFLDCSLSVSLAGSDGSRLPPARADPPFRQSGLADENLRLLEDGRQAGHADAHGKQSALCSRSSPGLQETATIQSLSFHPSGQYVLAGTTHPTLRLYSVETQQCWVSPQPRDQHTNSIMDVNYSDNGGMYVTASRVRPFLQRALNPAASLGRERKGVGRRVQPLRRNLPAGARRRRGDERAYILTAGMDSTCKLWELSANRCLIAYTGAGATGPAGVPDPGLLQPERGFRPLSGREERQPVLVGLAERAIGSDFSRWATPPPRASSSTRPRCPPFVTGSDDHRARFWVRKTAAH